MQNRRHDTTQHKARTECFSTSLLNSKDELSTVRSTLRWTIIMLCFRWEAQKSKRYATRAATVMGLILAHLQFNLVLTIRGLHHVHQTP